MQLVFMYCVWHWNNNNIEAKNSLNYYTAMEVLLVLRLTAVMWLLMRLVYYTVSCILQSKLMYLLFLQDTEDSTDDDFEKDLQQAIAVSKMSTVGEPSHTRRFLIPQKNKSIVMISFCVILSF